MTPQTKPRHLKDPVRASIVRRMHMSNMDTDAITDVTGWTDQDVQECLEAFMDAVAKAVR